MTLNSSYKGELLEVDALLVLQYLDSPGIQDQENKISLGPCPLCNQVIEKGVVFDELFIWEKSLSHAVLHHRAKPPEAFLNHVRKVMNMKSLFHVLEEGG